MIAFELERIVKSSFLKRSHTKETIASTHWYSLRLKLWTRKCKNVMATTKADPWLRRKQWWLTGGLVLVVVALTLATVLTTVDLNPDSPTMAPTSEF
jgi:hypothetical protein